MKNIFLIVFCLLVSTVWAKEEKNKRIQYCTTLEEAMQQAARKHKPIFFNCYAGWAGPSVLMDSVVLTDPDLVSFIQKHFVSLRVDMPKTQEGRKLAERYRVKFYAHYLILDEKGEKEKLAFVGDGINDAPVLSRADIGIAMGALGSDAAIEAADIVLMDDDPLKISKAIRISRKCLRIVYENIYFAIGVKVVCLILGALGIANMWAAIFADVGVMIIAVLNAIRALNVKKL